MESLVERLERWVAGTPFDGPAQWLWSELSSLGDPEARQSLRYDRQTVRIMSRVLREDSNCVDVGAHRGSLLRHMVRLAPSGRHIAFEPIPRLARLLEVRFPGVEIHELALSDSCGRTTFCYVPDSPGKSGFRRMGHVSAGARTEELTVATDTLDRVVSPDLPVDFVKVDVEGAQLQVFRGATRTLSRWRPFVVFEHGKQAEESYGTTSEMVFDLLVGRCGLEISLLSRWLDGGEPLNREEFSEHVGYHADSHFCFLAHP